MDRKVLSTVCAKQKSCDSPVILTENKVLEPKGFNALEKNPVNQECKYLNKSYVKDISKGHQVKKLSPHVQEQF